MFVEVTGLLGINPFSREKEASKLYAAKPPPAVP